MCRYLPTGHCWYWSNKNPLKCQTGRLTWKATCRKSFYRRFFTNGLLVVSNEKGQKISNKQFIPSITGCWRSPGSFGSIRSIDRPYRLCECMFSRPINVEVKNFFGVCAEWLTTCISAWWDNQWIIIINEHLKAWFYIHTGRRKGSCEVAMCDWQKAQRSWCLLLITISEAVFCIYHTYTSSTLRCAATLVQQI